MLESARPRRIRHLPEPKQADFNEFAGPGWTGRDGSLGSEAAGIMSGGLSPAECCCGCATP